MVLLFALLAFCSCTKYIITRTVSDYEEFFPKSEDSIKIGNLVFNLLDTEEDVSILNEFPGVLAVEKDEIISINQKDYNLQRTPIWGLDRIDQRTNELNELYFYPKTGGKSVYNYVLDTGIDISHVQFGGRAKFGMNYADNESETGCMHPHGTHVGGTIASKTFGIAKSTNLISVKVLDCKGSGNTSNMLKAFQFVQNEKFDKKIINMSLGGGFSQAMNLAITELSKLGIIVVAAAGNENADACLGSPSSAPEAITVGAIDKNTNVAGFSNWGRCLDVYAPGNNILSTMPKNLTGTMSGTSMACPHVAGLVTLLLDSYTGKIDVKKITEHLLLWSTKNKISGDTKGSPNVLGFSLMPDLL